MMTLASLMLTGLALLSQSKMVDDGPAGRRIATTWELARLIGKPLARGSKSQVFQEPFEMAFDLASGSLVGRQVGADGVVDVVAGGVEKAGSRFDVGNPVEQDIEMVGGHGDDVVGMADQVGRGPSTGVLGQRTAS